MKKAFNFIIAVLIIIVTPTVFAETKELLPDPDLLTYTASDGNEYFYHDLGSEMELVFIYPASGKDSLTVLSEISGKPITKISYSISEEIIWDGAEQNRDIKTIRIPGCIETVVPESCFMKMRGIENVIFEEGVKTISGSGFSGLKSVSLPKSLETIGEYAFSSFKGETIEIPDSVTTIGDYAFRNAYIKDIKLSKNLKTIGSYAFERCNYLESIEFPESLQNIGDWAFHYCSDLEEIVFPKSLKSVGKDAFYKTGLKKAVIHDGIVFAENSMACDELTEIEGMTDELLAKYWTAFKYSAYAQNHVPEGSDYEFIINDGVLEAYLGTSETVVIPDTVKIIGKRALSGKNITSLTIPSSVKQIEAAACTNMQITELVIPSSVTSIGNMAFGGNKKLKTITIEPGRWTVIIHDLAFSGCDALKMVEIKGDTNMSDSAFSGALEETLRETGLWKKSAETEKSEAMPVPEVLALPSSAPGTTPPPAKTTEPTASPEPQIMTVSNGGELTVTVGDKAVVFTDAKPFIDENNRTQVPMRAVAQMLKANVDWDGETRTVTISKGERIIKIVIGSDAMAVDGKAIKMDTAAIIKDNRTYIPVRFVAEALGLTVEWK